MSRPRRLTPEQLRANQLQQNRDRFAARQARGDCRYCGKPNPSRFVNCLKCRLRQAARDQQRRDRRRKAREQEVVMEQTYTITRDGLDTYHFHGRTITADGGSHTQEYATGTDLERVRAEGVQRMEADVLHQQRMVVEEGKLDHARAKVSDSESLDAVQRRALAKLTPEEWVVLGLAPPLKD